MSVGPLPQSPHTTNPPQFRLRTIFIAVTLIGIVFGVMHALGPSASVAFILALSTVGLHVAASALGTSRRDETTAQLGAHPAVDRRLLIERCEAVKADHRLREHSPLGWAIRLTTITGAAAGMTLGVIFLSLYTGAAVPGVIFGAISAAVLGGFLGFLAGSFLEVTRRAWWQATCDSEKDNCN